MERFEKFKDIILNKAKEERACKEQYQRALKSGTFEDLISIIKDNFQWSINHKIIDPILIKEYKEEFHGNGICCNENICNGFLLATGNATVEAYGNATVRATDNATVRAYDNATVRATGNATVEAYGNATVRATDNATVRATGNATVEATDNATVEATGNATVRAYDNATVRAYDNATVRATDNATVRATDNATVRAYDNATVRATGNAYIYSYYIIECKLKDNAVYRLISENKIFYPEETAINIEKQTTH